LWVETNRQATSRCLPSSPRPVCRWRPVFAGRPVSDDYPATGERQA
jgi:hypothetical protein